MLNGLDLFSGYGGISYALRDYVRPIAYCEKDTYCQAVLLNRMAEQKIAVAPIWPDIRNLDKACIDDMLSLQKETDSMAGKLKKLTEEQAKQAATDYENGMSLGDLAHIYGITRQGMWDLIRRRTSMREQKRYGKDNHFYRGGSRADQRAHDILEKAVLYGKLHNPEKCEACGNERRFADGRTAIQGHHDDYNKPLTVRWLCQRCHHDWHKTNKPIPYSGEPEVSEHIDIVFGGFP